MQVFGNNIKENNKQERNSRNRLCKHVKKKKTSRDVVVQIIWSAMLYKPDKKMDVRVIVRDVEGLVLATTCATMPLIIN
jgi:hypothetical protein